MITDGVLANAANFNAAFESKNKQVRSVTSSGAVTSSDDFLQVNCTSGAVTMTLPAASLSTGKMFRFQKTDATTNKLIIDPNASETIGGFSTLELFSPNQVCEIYSDGNNWDIVANGLAFNNGILDPMGLVSGSVYNMTPWDEHLRASAPVGGLTINLPAITDAIRGKRITIQRRGGAYNDAISIVPNGSDIISYNLTSLSIIRLMTIGETITLQAINGNFWIIVDRYIPSVINDYTPVWSSGGTQPSIGNGTLTGKWRRVGCFIEAEIYLLAGSTTTFGTGSYAFSLPTNMSFGFSRMASGGSFLSAGVRSLGGMIRFSSSYYNVFCGYNTTTTVFPAYGLASGSATQFINLAFNEPFTWTNGTLLSFAFSGPIANWEG